MAWTYRLLGRVGFNVVLAPVMFYFLLRRRIARRASLDYLARVKREYPDSIRGEPGLWLTFRHFLAFGRMLLDKYVALTGEPTSEDCQPNGVPDECDPDCNGNGIADGCDGIGPGDFDGDGDSDLDDYAWFAACLAGPGVSPNPASPCLKPSSKSTLGVSPCCEPQPKTSLASPSFVIPKITPPF